MDHGSSFPFLFSLLFHLTLFYLIFNPRYRISEIRDAKLIFNQAFKNVQDIHGRENMKFPKEIIWLMGAPGSGKGTHTPAILRARGITNPSISMSSLLATPECKELINKGMMVSDGKVVENLLHALLDCEPEVGVLVDGFPRSEVQVECLKLFHERMHELRKEFKHTPLKDFFPRPTFRICVLYVDEEISVNRQLMRGKLIQEHNAQVMRSGKGEIMEERVTDFDELVCLFQPLFCAQVTSFVNITIDTFDSSLFS